MHLIKSLVEHGANIEARGYENNTPMMIALWSGWFHLVRYFVSKGADINSKHKWGLTPLQRIITFLAKRPYNNTTKESDENAPTYQGYLGILTELIDAGADINVPLSPGGLTPLHLVIDTCNVKLVKLLVNGGARVNDGGMIGTPLMHAAVLHQAETVEICKILITNGAEIHHVDHSDYPLLRRAVECGNIHTMRLFVEQESDVHMTDQANRNLLHHAVTLGEPEGTRICEFLVEKGVDLHHRDCRQETPFLTAARFGNIAIIKLLIWSGANINDVDDQGWNALHFTAEAMVEENRYRYRPASKTQHYKDFIRVVQFLLESSCLPSVRILSGQFEKVEIPREVQRAFLGIEE